MHNQTVIHIKHLEPKVEKCDNCGAETIGRWVNLDGDGKRICGKCFTRWQVERRQWWENE